ncbi:hypothetical protein MP228_012194 [Amoeboaphelidium protococcarum]|nr:hypothetical protein MP228_012194 [Amoeboaphelidium protococcarum]
MPTSTQNSAAPNSSPAAINTSGRSAVTSTLPGSPSKFVSPLEATKTASGQAAASSYSPLAHSHHHHHPHHNNSQQLGTGRSDSPSRLFSAYPLAAEMEHASPSQVASKIVADYYQWPVFFAVLPPLLTIYYGGKIEEWSEGFMLLIIAFYLYGLIKLPWELYVSAKVNYRQISRVAQSYTAGITSPQHPAEKERQAAVWRLWFLEWFYFGLVFACPFAGAVFLRYIRPHLHVYRHLINDFPMALYVLTAYIRPLIHLSRLLKQHASSLQYEVHYPNTDVDMLKKKVTDLELRMASLTSHLSEQRDDADRKIRNVLESQVEPHLRGLNKDLKRTAKKEQRYFLQYEDRFQQLEKQIGEQLRALDVHRKQRDRPLLSTFYRILDSIPTVGTVITLPLHMALYLTTWWLPKSMRKRLMFKEHNEVVPRGGGAERMNHFESLDVNARSGYHRNSVNSYRNAAANGRNEELTNGNYTYNSQSINHHNGLSGGNEVRRQRKVVIEADDGDDSYSK